MKSNDSRGLWRTPAVRVAFAVGAMAVAPPVGYVEIAIPPRSQAMVSMSFIPADPSLDAVLLGQLTASTNPAAADRVLVWDATNSRYRTAAKMTGSDGDPVWVEVVHSDADEETVVGPAGDDFRFEPGRAAILWNRQYHPQVIRLSGQVVLDAERSVPIPAGLTMAGLPYSTAIPLARSCLPEHVGISDTNAFRQGEGYWIGSARQDAWKEPRPYGNPFSLRDAPVSVSGVSFDGDRALVDIRVSDPKVKAVDVLILDLAPSSPVEDWIGWTVAATGLAVDGSNTVRWCDDLVASAPAFRGVRLFLVLRADSAADADGDGVPDLRARFTGESAGRLTTAAGATVPASTLSVVSMDSDIQPIRSVPRAMSPKTSSHPSPCCLP